jgi:hypothetical protein
VSGSSYHRIARLATHPAWSHRKVALVCPVCHAEHLRVSDYERDFLAHQPDAELAWRWLSGRRYEREAPRRGWPCADDMTGVAP